MTESDRNIPLPTDPTEPNAAPATPAAPAANEGAPAATPAAPQTPPEEKILYRWNFAEHTAAPGGGEPPRKKKGLLIYSIVLGAVFLVSFAMLIAVLWVGRYDPEHSVNVGVAGSHDDVAIDGVEQALHSVVVIEVVTDEGVSSGSGIILRRDGYIATNHHVIEGATSIQVSFYDGTAATARVIGSSENDDLAVIKVDRGDLTEARFAAYEGCYVGQTVYAIGAPAGPEFGWTVTKGIISYKDREVKVYDEDGYTLLRKMRLVQTDAMVNPGNSGGALINTDGEVVGVVSMKLAEGYEGIGFAIPADGAAEILEAIIDGEDFHSSVSYERPMLGITCVSVEEGKYYVRNGNSLPEIDADHVSHYDADKVVYAEATGVLVMSVADGMGAVGKLEAGDIITGIDGHAVATGDELSDYVNDLYVGDTVKLTVYRDGDEVEISLTLTAQVDES